MDDESVEMRGSLHLNFTLMGADIVDDGRIGGALQIRPDIDGYATGTICISISKTLV